MEEEYKFKDYKEKQAHFKRINKERGKFLFVSKTNPTEKGKTYYKPEEEKIKEKGGIL